MATQARKQLIVKNMPQPTETRISELFDKFGKISSWNVKNTTDANKKEVIIEFETEEIAQQARSDLNNTTYEDSTLQIDFLLTQPHFTSTSSTIVKNLTPVTQRIKKAPSKSEPVKFGEKPVIILKKDHEQISGSSIEDRLVTSNRDERPYEKAELVIIKPSVLREEEKKIELRRQKSEDKSQYDSKSISEASSNPNELNSNGVPTQIVTESNQIPKIIPKESENKEEEKSISTKHELSFTRSDSNDKSQAPIASISKHESSRNSRSKSPEVKRNRPREQYIEGGLIITKPNRSRSRDREKSDRDRHSGRSYGDRGERDREHERDKGGRDYRSSYGSHYEVKERQDDYRSKDSDYKRDNYYYENRDRERDSRHDHSSHSKEYRDNRDYRDRRSSSRDRYRDYDHRDSRDHKSHSDYRDRDAEREKSYHRYDSGKDREYKERDSRDRYREKSSHRDYDRERDYRDHDRDRDHRDHGDHKDRDREYKHDRDRDYRDKDYSRDHKDHDYGRDRRDHYDGSHQRGYDSYGGYRDKDYQRDRYDDDYHGQSKNRESDRDKYKRSKSKSRSRYDDKYGIKKEWSREKSSYRGSYSPKLDLRHSNSFPGSQNFTVSDPIIPILQNSLSTQLTAAAIPAINPVLNAALPVYPINNYPYYPNPYAAQTYYQMPAQGLIPITTVPSTNASSIVGEDILNFSKEKITANSNEKKQSADTKNDSLPLPNKSQQETGSTAIIDETETQNGHVEDKEKPAVIDNKEIKKELPNNGVECSKINENNKENETKKKLVEKKTADPLIMNEFKVYPKEILNKFLKYYYSGGNWDVLKTEINKLASK